MSTHISTINYVFKFQMTDFYIEIAPLVRAHKKIQNVTNDFHATRKTYSSSYLGSTIQLGHFWKFGLILLK